LRSADCYYRWLNLQLKENTFGHLRRHPSHNILMEMIILIDPPDQVMVPVCTSTGARRVLYIVIEID